MNSILLAHPDGKVRAAVRSILEKSGRRISTAADGPQALNAFTRAGPDIVILNHELPGMASFRVFAEIKKTNPLAKVLLLAVQGLGPKHEVRFGIPAFRPGEVLRIVEELEDGSKRTRAQLERFAPRILVVDDDLDVLDTMRRFLTEKGYEVAVAPSGMDALPLFKKFRPHLVLLDIDMPKMSGVETLKRIRDLDGQVGVMMVTGNDAVEAMERCRDYGAYDYLLKPFDFRYFEFSVYSKILLMTC
jgi:two-component system response regulator (stage 0 sporulation protein F)